MTDYTVAHGINQNALTAEVIRLLGEGWELVGGISAVAVPTVDGAQMIFFQALGR